MKKRNEKKKAANIYVCISLTELYRALAVHHNKYREYTDIYLYSDFVIQLPAQQRSHLTLSCRIVFAEYGRSFKQGTARFIGWARHAKQIQSIVKQISRKHESVNLALFHDNWAFFPTLMEQFLRMRNAADIILLEDGISLYNPYKEQKEHRYFTKKILFKVLGLSPYALISGGIGWNRHLSVILCHNPDDSVFDKRKKRVFVDFEGPVFTKKSLLSFLHRLGISQSQLKGLKSYSYIFLTQPMEEATDRKLYLDVLHKVFRLLKATDRVLIKKHPRDQGDYSEFLNQNVDVCDKVLELVPAECLISYLDEIHVLTFSSSAAYQGQNFGKKIYLYRLIPDSRYTASMEDVHVLHSGENPNSYAVKDLEELKQLFDNISNEKCGV